MKAERRQRAQLNRSSSLLDLSTTAKDRPAAAGSQAPSAAAKPVPGRKTHIGGVGQRRVTLDAGAAKRLPRESPYSLVPSCDVTDSKFLRNGQSIKLHV